MTTNPARAFTAPIRMSAERAKEARKVLIGSRVKLELSHAGLKGTCAASPTLGDALNAGYLYLEVRCLGCDTNQTVALDIVRRPKTHAGPRA